MQPFQANPSRQHPDIAALMPFHHVTQLSRSDHLDLVAPLVQVPSHLDPAARGERDAQRAVRLISHHLIGMELEFARGGGRAGREAPDDR